MPRDLTKGLLPTSQSVVNLADDIEAELAAHPELRKKWLEMLKRHGNQKVLSGEFEADINPGAVNVGPRNHKNEDRDAGSADGTRRESP